MATRTREECDHYVGRTRMLARYEITVKCTEHVGELALVIPPTEEFKPTLCQTGYDNLIASIKRAIEPTRSRETAAKDDAPVSGT